MHTLQVTQVVYTTKMDGQEITIDFSKMHHSWLEAHLKKAAQRYLNDTYSGLMPSEKLAQARKDLAVIHSGEAMVKKPKAAGSKLSGDPIRDLALKTAKVSLMVTFQKRTKAKTIADILAVGDEKVNKYFGEKAPHAWNDKQVMIWIESEKEKGRRDYMQEAADLLAEPEESDEDDDDI